MKKIIFSLGLLMLLSCNKEDETTNLPTSLQAFTENNDCTCAPYIKEYKWRGITVFLKGFAGPACNWVPAYYNKDGAPITMADGYSLQDFMEEADFVRLVWQC